MIIDINQCGCKDDKFAYDIGFTIDAGISTQCATCKVVLPGRGIRWVDESRFKKKEAGKFKYGKFIYSKPKIKK